MKKYKFPDSHRIRLKNDFESVFKQGRKLSGFGVVMWYKTQNLAASRLGVIASKKLGGAVARNRIKRLIREVFRLNQHGFKIPVDIILYPTKAADFNNFSTTGNAILALWKKAGMLKDD